MTAPCVPDPPLELPSELDEDRRHNLAAEVARLKEAKQRAVEEEDYEEAAVLKRKIKVLEDTLGETVKYQSRREVNEPATKEVEPVSPKPKVKPLSQIQHGEDLWQMPPADLRLIEDERIFIERSKMAMRQKGVTDDTVQGVPAWAYKDALKEGPKGVRTDRPPELAYVYNGQIEDEKWEENANFQASIVVQVPVEVAFDYVLARSQGNQTSHQLQVGPGAFISHHASGVAQLTELLGSEVVENEMVSFKITMMKPKVPGKVKLDLAKTVQSKEAFRKHPFYTFRSVWKLQPYPAGGTRITRIVRDFKQWEIFDFDALNAVSRSIEVENEEIRQSWTSALRVQPDKALAKHDLQRGQICQVEVNSKEMYSASFLLEVSVDQAFRSITSNGLLTQYHNHLCADSFLCLDEMRVLIRQVNGIVLLVTSRLKADMGSWMTMTVGHNAGSKEKALEVTTEQEVLSKPLYRVVNEWHFRSDNGKTLVRRTMRDFMQMEEGIPDLPATLTEAADEENRKIIKAFERMRSQDDASPSRSSASAAMSVRANYAMRQMPAILDHAAKNHVLEVREMLEVKGADPNYIHVRKDSWAISDTRLEFYEEITPLVVAAEYGACEVIKVLFNHPQIDVNLCCCAFNDSEIYNYYTAYDVTIAKKHPHAAALLRARGVLPATSEHVYKPPFDPVHGRPLRETLNHTYEEDSFGEGEMPRWDTVAQGDPELALELQKVADALSTSKGQSLRNRNKIFKALITDWHPDRAQNSYRATRVFQWLQVVKPWYLEEKEAVAGELPPLMQSTDEEFGPGPGQAKEYMHPSGNLFSVW
ncbi:unnamed protein product [Durusdinium trenchii]|uniref:UVR domain-containing protein n=1 Tax=Durusdinium trenchii TaxID=1381693 RepID=A0ABP0HF58_9DINO